MGTEKDFIQYATKEFESKGKDIEEFKSNSPEIWDMFINSFRSYSVNDLRADMKITCRVEQVWLENMILAISFFKFLRGDAQNSNLLTKRALTVLALYFKVGLGSNSKEARRVVRDLEGLTDRELNSLTKSLRDKGFLKKGQTKESDNYFCQELEFLRVYCDYIDKNNLNVININFQFVRSYGQGQDS